MKQNNTVEEEIIRTFVPAFVSFFKIANFATMIIAKAFCFQTVDSSQLERYFLAQKDPKLREEFEMENRRSKDNSPSTKMINVSALLK